MKPERHESVLDDKKNITGLPSDEKSSVEKARNRNESTTDCDNALDGPACIDGVEEKSRDR